MFVKRLWYGSHVGGNSILNKLGFLHRLLTFCRESEKVSALIKMLTG